MKSNVVVTQTRDTIELRAILHLDEYPKLDRFDAMVIRSPEKSAADLLQSMEILFRRGQEQAEADK